MSLRIRKGDKVIVTAGKDKGKSGKVLKVVTAHNQYRIVVEGINLVKKHIRRRSENEPGGVKEIPLSLNASSAALFCSHCNKGVRFGAKAAADKLKARICKKCRKPL